MTEKRLTFNVPESLHSRLKAEAAELGISLGSHCTSILENESEFPIEKKEIGPIESLPLDSLRKLSIQLREDKPKDWRQKLTNVNTEIRRRYRV